MAVLALLPLLFLMALFLVIYSKLPPQGTYSNIRLGFLYAVLSTGLYGVAITELLSLFSLLSFKWLLLTWGLPGIVILFFFIRQQNAATLIKEIGRSLASAIRGSWILMVVAFFLAVSLGLALAYPPNNYDSITYHMARVAHWEQNQSIAFYPTHVIRQLVLSPMAEWIILHFQILTGSDRLANAVQLFFFGGCMINVSLLVKILGGTRRQQLLGILFTCMIPMAVIQSNTTQNDIVVAYFITAFVFLAIRCLQLPVLLHFLFAGTALGLAFLTKGTAYLFTLPFCLWMVVLLFRSLRVSFKDFLNKALLLAIVPAGALLINSGFYYRNILLTNEPLGTANTMTANEAHAIKPLMLVGFKSFLNHMPVTREFKEKLTAKTQQWGLDVNDEKYSHNTIQWMKEGFSFNEDYVQNFVHTVLIVIFGMVFLFRIRDLKRQSCYIPYIVSLLVSIVLFTVCVKWQPWSNRLETGLFMLFSAFLAIEVGYLKKWLQPVFYLPMMGFGTGALLWSVFHPVFPISQSIFKQSYDSFMYTEGELKLRSYLDSTSYKKIGIWIGPDSRDYTYFKALSKCANGERRTLKHVKVYNGSARYEDGFEPEAVICLNGVVGKIIVNEKPYYNFRELGPGLAIFIPRKEETVRD